jgi:hypothetical protein
LSMVTVASPLVPVIMGITTYLLSSTRRSPKERPNETVEKHPFDYSDYIQSQDFNALLMSYPIQQHVHHLMNSSPIKTYSIAPPILVDFADIVHQGK